MTKLTQSRLVELLCYDMESGQFTNKTTRHHKAKAGEIAGSRNGCGYHSICLDGSKYLAHRLAWLYVTGKWPDGIIDHVDSNRANNAWMNLRDVSVRVNQQNRTNASAFCAAGLLGAFKVGTRFKSSIRAGGKANHLGYFDTAEAAHSAYIKAKRRLHSGCEI